MKNDEMQAFAQLLSAVSGLYKHSLSELSLEIYWQALVGFEFDAVKQALFVLRPPSSYPRQLTGRLAWQNSQHGHGSQTPLLIGDPEKATQVYQQGRAPECRDFVTPLSLVQQADQTVAALTAKQNQPTLATEDKK